MNMGGMELPLKELGENLSLPLLDSNGILGMW